jgi:hypothetical protein
VQALPSSQAFVLFVKTQPVAGLQLSVVQALLSLHTIAVPGRQMPPPHVSPEVHTLPSSQAFVLLVNAQPVAGLHVSVVQTLPSLQTTPAPAWHVPPPQVSPDVQAFPSSQAIVLFVKTHPVAGLHESVVQALPSSQAIAVPPHAPPPQTSPDVHAFPSSQAIVLFVKTHPVAGLHASSVHTLPSSQTTGVPGWQAPPPQISPTVQASPSSQAFVLFVNTHPLTGLQLSVVQRLLSLHTIAAPGRQVPPPHVSPEVHAFPSSQALVLLVNTHPMTGLHESVVQGFASLQTTAVPVHAPPLHTSPVVQALPSSQAIALFVKTQPVAGLHESVVHALPSSQAFALSVKTHPVDGLHVSVVQALPSLQTIAVPPHAPPPQTSADVQALASSHAAVLFVKTQPVAGSHVSSVHTLASSQTTGVPGRQAPPAQVSPTVQASPSSQAFVLFVNTHPLTGLQLSVVQRLLSLHTIAAPGRQVPPPHVSPEVHAFPSSQAPVLLVNTQPVAGLQLSVVQILLSSQTVGAPG